MRSQCSGAHNAKSHFGMIINLFRTRCAGIAARADRYPAWRRWLRIVPAWAAAAALIYQRYYPRALSWCHTRRPFKLRVRWAVVIHGSPIYPPGTLIRFYWAQSSSLTSLSLFFFSMFGCKLSSKWKWHLDCHNLSESNKLTITFFRPTRDKRNQSPRNHLFNSVN